MAHGSPKQIQRITEKDGEREGQRKIKVGKIKCNVSKGEEYFLQSSATCWHARGPNYFESKIACCDVFFSSRSSNNKTAKWGLMLKQNL